MVAGRNKGLALTTPFQIVLCPRTAESSNFFDKGDSFLDITVIFPGEPQSDIVSQATPKTKCQIE